MTETNHRVSQNKVTRWIHVLQLVCVHVAKFQVFSEDGATPDRVVNVENLLKRKPHNKYFSSANDEATKTRRTMRRGSLFGLAITLKKKKNTKLTFITNAFLYNKAARRRKSLHGASTHSQGHQIKVKEGETERHWVGIFKLTDDPWQGMTRQRAIVGI